MNIAAANSASISHQTSFGKEYNVEDAQRVLDLSKELNDSFAQENQPEKKGVLGKAASYAGAVASIYITGLCLAKLVSKAGDTLIIPCLRNGANFVKNSAAKLSGVENKYISSAARNVSKAENLAREAFVKIRNSENAQGLFGKIVGTASVVAVAPKILKADGNKDGVSDIAQKNINAYSSAVRNMGIVSEMIETLG